MPGSVCIVEASEADTRHAIQTIVEALAGLELALVMVFVGEPHDPRSVAAMLSASLPDVRTVGCSTGGEIGPGGWLEGSLVAVAFGGPARASVSWFEDLSAVALEGRSPRIVDDVAAGLGLSRTELDPKRHVFITLVDGMRSAGELFIAGLTDVAPGIPLVGGSAGSRAHQTDTTWTFADGVAEIGSGVLVLLEPGVPFETFATHSFEPGRDRLVVTRARPDLHLLDELNGHSAVDEYARVVGVDPAAVRDGRVVPSEVGIHLGFLVDGELFLRGLIEVRGDGFLLGGAVEEGMVLRTACPRSDVVETTRAALNAVFGRTGAPEGVLFFECIGRKLGARATGATEGLVDLMDGVPVAGFHTFGEQFNALQVNLTLTGLALGRSDD